MRKYWKNAEEIYLNCVRAKHVFLSWISRNLDFFWRKYKSANGALKLFYVTATIFFLIAIINTISQAYHFVRITSIVIRSMPYPYYNYMCHQDADSSKYCRLSYDTPYGRYKSEKLISMDPYLDLNPPYKSFYELKEEFWPRAIGDPIRPYQKIFDALVIEGYLIKKGSINLNLGTLRRPNCEDPEISLRECLLRHEGFGVLMLETTINNKFEDKIVFFYVELSCEYLSEEKKVVCSDDRIYEDTIKIEKFEPMAYYCLSPVKEIASLYENCTE